MSSLQRDFFERPDEFYAEQEARATAKWIREHLERAARAEKREALGLSNPPYFAVDVSDVNFSVRVKPASVEVRLSDRIARTSPPLVADKYAKRGIIKELSDRSRQRLQARAYSLQAQGHKAQVMITLTSPANWEWVYIADENGEAVNGGRLFKRHMELFKKRLTRFMDRFPKLRNWKALWFLEFQKRGAPHVHIMLFAVSIPDEVRKALSRWAGVAWSEIVGNPDSRELAKHKKACSRVERMRSEHFGYAAKYASKAHQKDVPEEFQGVGRFWGNWNHAEPKPDDFSFPIHRFSDLQDFMPGLFKILSTVAQYQIFYNRTLGSVYRALGPSLWPAEGQKQEDIPPRIKNPVSFTVFGERAKVAFLDWLTD